MKRNPYPPLSALLESSLCRALTAPLRTGWELIVVGLVAFWLNWTFTDYPRPDFWPYFWLLGMDLFVVAALMALLPRRWRMGAKGVWYTGMYLMGFIESFLYKRFYIIYAPTALTLALETNGGEAGEFFSSCMGSRHLWPTLWPWLLMVVLHLAVAVGINNKWKIRNKKILCPTILRQGLRRTLYILYIAVPLSYCIWQAPVWWQTRTQLLEFCVAQDTGEAEKATSNIFFSAPLRLLQSVKFYRLAQKEMDHLADNMQSLQVDSCAATCPHIVLIIGESYNKHHSQVYGYERPTTPYQSRFCERGTMVAFTDVTTPWNLTSNVFKNMLSTHSVDASGSWTDGVLFPALFRQAGYHVSFITNQFQQSNRQNKADFNGSFFLNDERFDSLCFDHRSTKKYKYDAGLLRELSDSTLMAVRGPRLTLFHLIGQHLVYKERFPSNRVVFHAEDYDRPDLTLDDRQIIADYDNATLYNDEIVARVCGHFKDEDAVVIYLADHGDEVFDGQIGMYGRNHRADLTPEVARGEFEVPLEIWGSRRFRSRHRQLWHRIQQASQRPFMIDDMSHLLLGLAGISCPQYDARRDLLSDQYVPRRRPLKDGVGVYEEIINRK